jgi:hypothetical protein
MDLTAEQIQDNWNLLMTYIDKYISSPRKEKLLAFYKKYEDQLIIMPASFKAEFHSCFPGGYIHHVLNVVSAAIKLDRVWREEGVADTYTIEELVFAAINHDLGKMGDGVNPSYIPATDEWRKEKLGEVYAFNTQLPFMTVPDRSLFLLVQNGIEYSLNEFLAIRLHDGIYDEANKPYLASFRPETKPRTAIMFVLHQADLMASRIEFEKEWLPKFGAPASPKPKFKKTKSDRTTSSLKSIGNSEELGKVINKFFEK